MPFQQTRPEVSFNLGYFIALNGDGAYLVIFI